jgi:hypothetical protein
MIAAYIEWRKQNPDDSKWSVQPAVQAKIATNRIEHFYKGLNYTPGVVDTIFINLEVNGNSLVGSFNNMSMSIVLDASDGTLSLYGQKKRKMKVESGALVTEEILPPTFSAELIVIMLSVRLGVILH